MSESGYRHSILKFDIYDRARGDCIQVHPLYFSPGNGPERNDVHTQTGTFGNFHWEILRWMYMLVMETGVVTFQGRNDKLVVRIASGVGQQSGFDSPENS